MKDNMNQDFGINRTEPINNPPSIISDQLHNRLYFKADEIIIITDDINYHEKQAEMLKIQLQSMQSELSKVIEENKIPYPVTLASMTKLLIVEQPHRGSNYPNITKRNISVVNESPE